MLSWLEFLKKGLSRKPAEDRIVGKKKYSGVRDNLKLLIPHIKQHWPVGLAGGVLIILTTLLALPVPLITRFLIDKVILANQLQLLAGTVALLVGIKLLGIGCGALQGFYSTNFERKVTLDIQNHLLDRTMRLPKSFFDSKEVGYLMSRLLGDVNGVRLFFSSTMVSVLSSVIRFIGGVGLLFYLKWQLAIVVLLILPMLVLLVRFFSGRMRILSHHGMEQNANVTRSVQESLSAISLIKAFSSEKSTVGKIMSKLRSSFQIGMEQTMVSSAANVSIGLMPEVARFIVLAAGAYWVIQGQWTLGSLLAFLAYLGYVFGPAHFLANVNLQLQGALAALERVSALNNIVPEENLQRGKYVNRLKGDVEFKDVFFSYDGKEMVLEDVSFNAHPGDEIAIVGPSGVGKTTLISLILSFYRPFTGDILFDGLSVEEYNLSSLRKRIGYVSQSPQLLSGTIMENLCYGSPEADEAQVKEMAKVAGIHDFISGLDEGYSAKVGEQGVNLSAGQKQRLALARALIKEPDILILDEPTSALDSKLERSIFEALHDLLRSKTLFVVAHRPSTFMQAKRILLLNEKRLVAVGTHRELMEKNAYYCSLLDGREEREM